MTSNPEPGPTPVVVSVPLEALEAAPRIRQCDHVQCDLYATTSAVVSAPFAHKYAFLCDTHAQGVRLVLTCWVEHARALNRALAWGQQMRTMKEGKP